MPSDDATPARGDEQEGLSRATQLLSELSRLILVAPSDSINAHWHHVDGERAREACEAIRTLTAERDALAQRVREGEADRKLLGWCNVYETGQGGILYDSEEEATDTAGSYALRTVPVYEHTDAALRATPTP